jgi:hypothetical protein
MPNWTRNELNVQADDPKYIKEFKDKVFTEDDKGKLNFDFEKIIPMPKNIFRGNLGKEEREKYGENNWYDWSIENWGTKWNAYETQINYDGEEELEIEFETAWDTPRPIIKKLSQMFPKLRFWGGYIHECWEGAGTFEEVINE